MIDLTTIILTKNEQMNIEQAILSVKKVSKRIVLVDSYSDDETVSIAKKHGVEVYFNKFVNYGEQFQWALENVGINTQWVFRFDADERLTNEGAEELIRLCEKHKDDDVNGFVFKLEITFLGKKLKHGGTYPFKKLCIFKFGHAYMERREMDEQIILTDGRSIEMKTVSKHEDYKDLTTWISKHNWYASRAAKDYLKYKNGVQKIQELDRSTKLRRFIKYSIYYKLPYRFRSWLYFFYRYILKFGFLDGREGFLYAFFQAYWYRVLVDAKIYEMKKEEKK